MSLTLVTQKGDVSLTELPLNMSQGSNSVVGSTVLTAAQLVTGSLSRGGIQGGAITDTTDSAANIIAALPNGAAAGGAWRTRLLNTTTVAQTLAAGSGVTLAGKAPLIAPNCYADVLIQYTAAGAVTLYVELVDDMGVDNLTATTDPTVANDNTQGYGPGSVWVNTTAGATAEWTCISAATGAAVWSFSGSKLGDPEPSSVKTQAGGAVRGSVGGSFGEEGNLYRSVGLPIAGNAAATTDTVLLGFQMPAGVFDQAARVLNINAQGNLAANGNNKRIKVWANPTLAGATVNGDGSITGGTVSGVGSGLLLFDSGVQTGNNIGWDVITNLSKYGATGSNTQTYQSMPIYGTTHGGVSLTAGATLPENAAINIVITGSSPTTGAASDVTLTELYLNFCN